MGHLKIHVSRIVQLKLKFSLPKSMRNSPLRNWISRSETNVNGSSNMLTLKMISQYRSPAVAGALLLAACVTAASSTVLAQEVPAKVATAQRETLLQTTQSWNGKPYTHYSSGQPQLTTLRVTIAPHTSLPWHYHPVPNVVYVISGTLTLRDRASGKTLVLHQGQAVGESVDDVHRGEAGDQPAVLLITYSGTPGVPTSIPAKGEKAEY
jgi:quercetin dioxygenase-like cupin family protein